LTLTFVNELDSVKLNQHAKYLGHKSLSSKGILRHIDRQTHPTNCSIRITKVVDNNITAR